MSSQEDNREDDDQQEDQQASGDDANEEEEEEEEAGDDDAAGDDDEDAAQEEEEEEEEEEDAGEPVAKKARAFVDDVAVDDALDEEEQAQEDAADAEQYEEEAKEEEEEEEEEVNADGNYYAQHNPYFDREDNLELPQKRNTEEEKQRRASPAARALEVAERNVRPPAVAPESLLIPTMRDPKFWMVPCVPGSERKVLMTVMKRFLAKRNSNNPKDPPLYIHSAFTTPNSKGYIYVEAEKEVHVKRAIRGLSDLRFYKLKLIPMQEMVQAVTVNVKPPDIKVGQWVRLARGIYKNDLAKIESVDPQAMKVTVRYIPRLDLAAIKDEVDLKAIGSKEKKRKSAARRSIRPLARLFNAQEFREMGVQLDRRDGYDFYKSHRFKNGFLFKEMNINAIQSDNVMPTPEEIDRFNTKLRDADADVIEEEDEKEIKTNQDDEIIPITARFVAGDMVKVIRGDAKNLTGQIVSVSQDGITIKAADLPSMLMQPNDLQKYFAIGDHIKIIEGELKGETGTVIQVLDSEDGTEDTLILYSDLTFKEMRIPSSYAMETTEVNAGRDALGQFQLYDLVQLINQDVIGVIVKVETQSVKILTNRGVLTSVRLQDIGRKRTSRFATALDVNQNEIQVDDQVQVIDGNNKNLNGTVKHIFRSNLFLHNPTLMQNSGTFVAMARQCSKKGQSRPKQQQDFNRNTPYNNTSFSIASPAIHNEEVRNPYGADFGGRSERGGRGGHTDRGGRGGGRGGARPQRAQRDPLVGKTVVVIMGKYKGNKGTVKEAHGSDVQIELLAIHRTIPLKRDQIMETTTTSSSHHRADPTRTPSIHMNTPAREDGRTPLHSAQTPGPGELSSATPMHSYHDEDSDSGWNPATPHNNDWRPDTPQHNATVSTPNTMVSPYDRAGGSMVSPYDRAGGSMAEIHRHDNQRRTAITPNTPTPHGSVFTPNTPADALSSSYQTPITPQTPATPHDDPMTPHDSRDSRGGSGAGSDSRGGSGYMSHSSNQPRFDTWILPGMFILVHGVVMNVISDVDGMGKVTVNQDGVETKVFANEATPVVPVKDDHVVVVAGDNRRERGQLIGVDGTDGIVKMASGDILIFEMRQLCKASRF